MKKELKPNPLYMQLRDIMRSRIEMGEFLPGMAIPSENELAEEYEVSRLTVRSAIEGLVLEGILQPVQGKGVFVIGKKIERDLETLTGFTRTMREKNQEPKNTVISLIERPAGAKFAEIFQIPEESPIYYLKRLNTANEVPVALEEIYTPKHTVPHLDTLNLADFSLYDLYDSYNIHITHAFQTLDVTKLNKNEARLLNIDTTKSVYQFKSLTYAKDVPVEYANVYVRPDLCAYNVRFYKDNSENQLAIPTNLSSFF